MLAPVLVSAIEGPVVAMAGVAMATPSAAAAAADNERKTVCLFLRAGPPGRCHLPGARAEISGMMILHMRMPP